MSAFQSLRTFGLMLHHVSMKMTSPLRLAAAAVSLVPGAWPASAAPPPPPRQANLASLQAFIGGLNEGRAELYASSLSDQLEVNVDGKLVAHSKTEWLNAPLASFTNGYNSHVKVENAYFGGTPSASGQYEERTILIERIERNFGDCCVYHRVETLTFRNGLIMRIDRSPELNLQLKPDGHRQDGLG